jgi:hypothetical protein
MERFIALQSALQQVKKIEQSGIDRGHLAGSEIPQDMINIFENARDVLAPYAICRFEVLTSVKVVEGDGPCAVRAYIGADT